MSPSKKAAVTPIVFLSAICKLQTMGIGSVTTKRSTTRLYPANANSVFFTSPQVPITTGLQLEFIGQQSRVMVRIEAIQ